MPSLKSLIILIAAAVIGGCATLTDSNQQQVAVHTVLDHREIGNVGCVLSNRAGRWFVNAPGQVTITKSDTPLAVDCKKADTGAGYDVFRSKLNAGGVWGNLIVSAGVGALVDANTGAGFDYPSTLTVLMRAAPQPAAPDQSSGAGGNPVY